MMIWILSLLFSIGSAGVVGADVNESGQPGSECSVRVNYDGKETITARQSNISDFEYISKQPGGQQLLLEINSGLTAEMVRELMRINKPLQVFPVSAKKGSKACDAMKEMARRLDERAKKKQWPQEKTEDLLVGSLLKAKIPNIDSSASGTAAPSKSGSTAPGKR